MTRRAELPDGADVHDIHADYDAAPSSSCEEPTESTPLFAGQQRRPGLGHGRTESILRAIHVPKVHSPDLIAGIFCAMILVGAGSGGLWVIPATRMVEDVVCRQYYDVLSSDTIDESMCKEDDIQSKVALIFAIYSALQASIGAVCAFPWGIVADRLGRKMVFSLTVLGMILDQLWFLLVCAFPQTLPLKALWFGPSMLVLGGGNSVLSAIVFSMLADVTTSENRSKNFMRVHLASMIGNLCSPALGGWMMGKTGPWPVIWLAFGGFSTLILTIHLVPETKPPAQLSPDPIANEPEAESPVLGAIQHTLHRVKESLVLFKSPSLIVLLVALLSSYPIAMSTYQFMTIFASKRYHISLSQTGYLSSLYGLGVLISIVVILPAFSKLLVSPTTPKPMRIEDDHQRDLFLARISSVALLIGALCMTVSPSVGSFLGGLAILSLGSGWGSYVRSVSTVFVDAAHRTRLYSIMSVVETAGQMYAQPMLAGLFSVGMKLGGFWIGLPYLGVAGFCVIALVLLLLVRLPAHDTKQAPEYDGENNAQPEH